MSGVTSPATSAVDESISGETFTASAPVTLLFSCKMDLFTGCIVRAITPPLKPPPQLNHLKLERELFFVSAPINSNSREQWLTPNPLPIFAGENILTLTLTLRLREARDVLTPSSITPFHLYLAPNETGSWNNAATELGLTTLYEEGVVPCRSKVVAEKGFHETHAAVAFRWHTDEYAIGVDFLDLKVTNFDFFADTAA